MGGRFGLRTWARAQPAQPPQSSVPQCPWQCAPNPRSRTTKSPGRKGLVHEALSPDPAQLAWPEPKATPPQARRPPEKGQHQESRALEAHNQEEGAQRKEPAGTQPRGPRPRFPRAPAACEAASLRANTGGWVLCGHARRLFPGWKIPEKHPSSKDHRSGRSHLPA